MIVCTQAIACSAMALEKEEGRLRSPLVAVITDFLPHAYWLSPEVDLYLVATPSARADLLRRGVDDQKIRVTGIPIHPRFAAVPTASEARSELGLHPGRPTIFVSGGSKGLGPISAAVAAIFRGVPQAQIIAACGSNLKQLKSLVRRYSNAGRNGSRLLALGYTDRIDLCLAASDLFVGKIGGVSAAEAIAVGIPIVALEPLPGAERRNARELERRGAALQSAGVGALPSELASLLASPQRVARLRGEALLLARPRAAAAAVREIAALARRSFLFRRPSIFG